MISISFQLIAGCMVGIEFDKDELGPFLIIDLFVLRIGFAWE